MSEPQNHSSPPQPTKLMNGDVIDGEQLAKILESGGANLLRPYRPGIHTATDARAELDHNDLFEISIFGESGSEQVQFVSVEHSAKGAVLALISPQLAGDNLWDRGLQVDPSVGIRIPWTDPRYQLTPEGATYAFTKHFGQLDTNEMLHLIDSGAEVNADCNGRGGTWLYWAIKESKTEVAISMLQNGAEPNDGCANEAFWKFQDEDVAKSYVAAGGDWDSVASLPMGRGGCDPEFIQDIYRWKAELEAQKLSASTQQAAGAWCPSPQQADDFAGRMTGQAQGNAQQAPQQQRARMRL